MGPVEGPRPWWGHPGEDRTATSTLRAEPRDSVLWAGPMGASLMLIWSELLWNNWPSTKGRKTIWSSFKRTVFPFLWLPKQWPVLLSVCGREPFFSPRKCKTSIHKIETIFSHFPFILKRKKEGRGNLIYPFGEARGISLSLGGNCCTHQFILWATLWVKRIMICQRQIF